MHVFLAHSHPNTNNVFRLETPVYDRNSSIFKGNLFIKQAKYE